MVGYSKGVVQAARMPGYFPYWTVARKANGVCLEQDGGLGSRTPGFCPNSGKAVGQAGIGTRAFLPSTPC